MSIACWVTKAAGTNSEYVIRIAFLTTLIKITESKREAAVRKGVRQRCNLLPLTFKYIHRTSYK
jgi:hypothetical protein